jgi:hypothetical protein
MSRDGIDQELKGVSILKKARSGGRKQPCSEDLSILGLISEADFSPLDRRSDSSFCRVVGWLNPLMFKECEKVIPMFEQTTGSPCHVRIDGQLVSLETIAHASPDRNRFEHKGASVHESFFEGVPQPEHSPDLRKHPFGEFDSVRTPAAMLESFEVSDNVSPADLALTFVKSIVGAEHVGTEYS